jgi:hypothetical protein
VCAAQQESQPAAQQEAQPAAEQPSEQPPPKLTGPAAFVQLQGSSTSLGFVGGGDVDLGYNLTKRLGGDIGMPFYFVRDPFSLTATKDWRYWTLWAPPYLDVHYTTTKAGVDITSVLTGSIPISNTRRIFTTGRFGADWFNHLERSIKWATPFVNFGAANESVERYYMPRPYSMDRPYETLGFIADGEAGASFKLPRGASIGASVWGLLPAGPQRVYSKFVSPDSLLAGDGQHYRYFDALFETSQPVQAPGVVALVGSGTFGGCTLANTAYTCKSLSSIARDNGYSAWIEVARLHRGTVQIGYTRSVHYALDTVTVMLKFDATWLVRKPQSQ